MTIDRIVREGLMVPDTGEACALGESFSHVLMGTSSKNRSPNLAMVIASGTSAICTQKKAWEAELLASRAEFQLQQGNSDWVSFVKDARFNADRNNHQTARRFYSSLQHLEAAFGPIGGTCPTIKEKDQPVYLIGLIAGLLAVLHDRAAGGTVGVPLDVLPKVGRSAICLDNEQWWQVPQALQAAVWASVPGAGPEDAEPWKMLLDVSEQGAASGVRVAWGITALVAGNSGRTDILQESITRHGQSLAQVQQSSTWALLDEYALEIARHQADLLWISEKGYRSPPFGELPTLDSPPEPDEQDPFGAEEDPFGSDNE